MSDQDALRKIEEFEDIEMEMLVSHLSPQEKLGLNQVLEIQDIKPPDAPKTTQSGYKETISTLKAIIIAQRKMFKCHASTKLPIPIKKSRHVYANESVISKDSKILVANRIDVVNTTVYNSYGIIIETDILDVLASFLWYNYYQQKLLTFLDPTEIDIQPRNNDNIFKKSGKRFGLHCNKIRRQSGSLLNTLSSLQMDRFYVSELNKWLLDPPDEISPTTMRIMDDIGQYDPAENFKWESVVLNHLTQYLKTINDRIAPKHFFFEFKGYLGKKGDWKLHLMKEKEFVKRVRKLRKERKRNTNSNIKVAGKKRKHEQM